MKLKNFIDNKFFFKLVLKIKSLFVSKPEKKLSWTIEDFKKGKKWAKTIPHPYSAKLTLWDYCLDKGDSALTLHNINKFI